MAQTRHRFDVLPVPSREDVDDDGRQAFVDMVTQQLHENTLSTPRWSTHLTEIMSESSNGRQYIPELPNAHEVN